MLFGVDISVHQRGIDIARIATEGYRFCLCRASIGVLIDDTFVMASRAVRAAGMVPGAYHWLRDGDGAGQADLLCRQIMVADPSGPAGWLVAVDVEDDSPYRVVTAFADRWRAISRGHPLLLYTGRWWWPPDWNGAAITPYLWHSEYVAGAGYGSVLAESIPAAWWTPGYGEWDRATILQYSSRGSVADRTIDIDIFRGDITELQKLTGADVDPIVEQSLRVAFAEPYDSIHGIDPQSWMARAVEAPLRQLLAASDQPIRLDDQAVAAVGDRLVEELARLFEGAINQAVQHLLELVLANRAVQPPS